MSRASLPSRSMHWMASILCTIYLVILGCGDPEKEPFRAPVLYDVSWTTLVEVVGEFPPEGGEFEGFFERSQFQGFEYPAPQSASLDISLDRISGSADPVLILYGPQELTGVWGSPIALDDDSGRDLNARLHVGPLVSGFYLVVAASRDYPSQGEYRLSVACLDNCDPATACPPPEGCDPDVICYSGYEVDEYGCPTCICNDECRTEDDCPPSMDCIRGVCREECHCYGPFEPVCVLDGDQVVTYPSPCEAACVGAIILYPGPCREDCPPINEFCDLECPHGYRLDDTGCPICECRQGCELCDLAIDPVCTLNGRSYLNPCLAQCEGEVVAHRGVCLPHCPVLSDCPERCERFFARDESGCALCECQDQPCHQGFPVCGANGVTYGDPCEAERAGVDIVFEGHCPPFCHGEQDCPPGYRCDSGAFGLPHCNPAEADCVAICLYQPGRCENESDCLTSDICTEEGQCISPCGCPRVFDPVCGDDLVVYDNDCRSFCQEVPPIRMRGCCDPDAILQCPLECPNYYLLDEIGCEICECAEVAPCACNEHVVDEVCGIDGNWYPNRCIMRCHGVRDSLNPEHCSHEPQHSEEQG